MNDRFSAALTEAVILKAPAKLNLGLRIPWRRPDGYHHLVSIFAAVDLTDEIAVQPAKEFSIILKNELPPGFKPGIEKAFTVQADGTYHNILYHTWQLVRQKSAKSIPPVSLVVTKRIPSPAGLGGGSSDAAALLKYLNRYAGFSSAELEALALALGADVPFFLQDGPVIVSGIGEPLGRLRLKPFCGVIGVPQFGFSTREMFATLKKDLQPEKGQQSVLTEAFLALYREVGWLLSEGAADILVTEGGSTQPESWQGVREFTNEFRAAIRQSYPLESRVLDQGMTAAGEALLRQSEVPRVAVGLSGSGSAIYAITEGNLPRLAEVVAELRKVQKAFSWFQIRNL